MHVSREVCKRLSCPLNVLLHVKFSGANKDIVVKLCLRFLSTLIGAKTEVTLPMVISGLRKCPLENQACCTSFAC